MDACDEPEIAHASKHCVALAQGAIGIIERGKAVGTADETGKSRGLGKIEFRSWLPEVGLACRLNAVSAGAEINAVHIGSQDFLLRQFRLNAEGQRGFDEFAVEVLSPEREAVSCKLLCDRASALAEASEEEVAHYGAGDADGINAVVFVKPRVLAADERVVEIVRDLVERHSHAVLAGETGIVFALVVVNHRALVHFVDFLQVEEMRPSVVAGSDDRPEQRGDDADF